MCECSVSMSSHGLQKYFSTSDFIVLSHLRPFVPDKAVDLPVPSTLPLFKDSLRDLIQSLLMSPDYHSF